MLLFALLLACGHGSDVDTADTADTAGLIPAGCVEVTFACGAMVDGARERSYIGACHTGSWAWAEQCTAEDLLICAPADPQLTDLVPDGEGRIDPYVACGPRYTVVHGVICAGC